MKFTFLVLLTILSALSASFAIFSEKPTVYLSYDTAQNSLTRNFRTAHQAPVKISSLNLKGLNHLKISGSGQFSERSFEALIKSLSKSLSIESPNELIVIDLRQESHGFINQEPVHWTDGLNNCANIDRSQSEIDLDEFQRLQFAKQENDVIISPKTIENLTVETVQTERDLVESYGATYIRLPVTDHLRPSDETVDRFVELIKNLSSKQWIHVHCKAGKGRTTTFLALFDMMKNAPHVNLEDILARQRLIGGSDLTEITKKNSERTKGAEEKLEFIQNFYLYAREVPDFDITWSEWIQK